MARRGRAGAVRQAAERGENLGAITAALGRLVERYGAAEVETAVLAALSRGVPHPNAVRLALETQREAHRGCAWFNGVCWIAASAITSSGNDAPKPDSGNVNPQLAYCTECR